MTTEITFPGYVPGNNGPKGLLRMNWRKRNKLRDTYVWWVKSKTKNRHAGAVKVTLTRHCVRKMDDYDNLVSTGKILMDAIVIAGVLIDDNMDIVKEREYLQVKASKNEQKTVITITDI
jgi:Holliday junction resolvase RusA-like endonuclease